MENMGRDENTVGMDGTMADGGKTTKKMQYGVVVASREIYVLKMHA